ncbi:MAG: N-acetylmuramoyl-L-alanine amidase [Chloroflexi bacterium]|nr:N-acetylmuramoyl-L-alanine amidase [Chloroflexota bacterium]
MSRKTFIGLMAAIAAAGLVLIVLILVQSLRWDTPNHVAAEVTDVPVTTEASVSPTDTPASTATPSITATATRLPTPSPMPTRSPTPKATYVVAIDPGHGGVDEGTYPYNPDGIYNYHESEVTLKIAQRLRRLLEAEGIEVVMIRDGDYGLNPDWEDVNGDGVHDIGDEAQARVDVANEAGADLMLSIHLNARTYDDGTINTTYNGATTYYCNARPFSDKSLRLAELVHQAVLEDLTASGYEPFDQGILDDLEINDGGPQLHLIALGPASDRIARPSQMPAVLDEPLFATSDVENALLADEATYDILAKAYARAILQYLSEQETP